MLAEGALEIVTYCEGDVTILKAHSDQEYTEAVLEMKKDAQERGTWKGSTRCCGTNFAKG